MDDREASVLAEELRYLRETTWCIYCCCTGCGLTQEGFQDCGCLNVKHKICCLRGQSKSKTPCSEGIISGEGKCCCLLSHTQLPPGPEGTPGLICCGAQLMKWGGKDKDDTAAWIRPGRDHIDEYFMKAFWCFYCGCCGRGCTQPLDPLAKGEAFVCCVHSQVETADMTQPDGLCNNRGQVCCLITHCRCLPKYTPGIACCGAKLCLTNLPDPDTAPELNGGVVATAPAQQPMMA